MPPREGCAPHAAVGASLLDPGPVAVGATFRTVLVLDHAAAAVGRPVRVGIAFDPRMVYCVAVEPPPPGGPSVALDAAIALGRVAVAVTVLAAGRDAPADRVPAATVQWRCVGEGDTRVEARVEEAAGAIPATLRIVQRPRG